MTAPDSPARRYRRRWPAHGWRFTKTTPKEYTGNGKRRGVSTAVYVMADTKAMIERMKGKQLGGKDGVAAAFHAMALWTLAYIGTGNESYLDKACSYGHTTPARMRRLLRAAGRRQKKVTK